MDSFESLHAALRNTNERVAQLAARISMLELGATKEAERLDDLATKGGELAALVSRVAGRMPENTEALRCVRPGCTKPTELRALAGGFWRVECECGLETTACISREVALGLWIGESWESVPAMVAARANENAGEDASTRKGDVGLTTTASNSSPASPASEIPSWVPSANEIASTLWLAAGLGAYHAPTERQMLELRRLIASRAPRPSTVGVDLGLAASIVFEMERVGPVLTMEQNRAIRVALRRASALPAPGAPKPASEAQGEPFKVGSTEHVAVWDAIDWFAKTAPMSVARMGAVERVETALRTLCLASRAPSPSPSTIDDDRATVDYAGDEADLGLRDRAREHLQRKGWTDSRTLWAMEDFARAELARHKPSPSPALACALKGCHREAVPKHAHCLQHEAELMLECGMLTNGLTASDVRAVLRQDAQSYDDEGIAKALNERLFQHRPPHPSPALAAIVEALHGARNDLIDIENYWSGHENSTAMADACKHNVEVARRGIERIDRARAALEGKDGGSC